MRMREAVEKIDREHPELTGDDRLRAIKALREEDAAARRRQKDAGVECAACRETVKPVEKNGLAALSVCVVLLALAALVASVVAAAHTFTDATVHGGWVVVLWPVAAVDGWVHPGLLAVLLAVVAVVTAAWVSVKLGERADRNARCPRCSGRVRAARVPQA